MFLHLGLSGSSKSLLSSGKMLNAHNNTWIEISNLFLFWTLFWLCDTGANPVSDFRYGSGYSGANQNRSTWIRIRNPRFWIIAHFQSSPKRKTYIYKISCRQNLDFWSLIQNSQWRRLSRYLNLMQIRIQCRIQYVPHSDLYADYGTVGSLVTVQSYVSEI